MSNKSNRKKIKSNSSIHWPTVILIIGLVVLLIPTAVMGLVFLDAFEGTGSALFGNRFTNEIQEEITKEQLQEVTVKLNDSDSTIKADVNLMSATLRVVALVSNDVSDEDIVQLTSELLNDVLTILPRETYFSKASSTKQYDLEVHVFNDRTVVEEENYRYALGVLNSLMEEPLVQLVSEPVDPEFVGELYQSILDEQNEENNDETESEGAADEGTGDNEGE